jgi:hypothetical protein
LVDILMDGEDRDVGFGSFLRDKLRGIRQIGVPLQF